MHHPHTDESTGPVRLQRLRAALRRVDATTRWGRVAALSPTYASIAGPVDHMVLHGRLVIETSHSEIPCEIVGFQNGLACAMPLKPFEAVRPGQLTRIEAAVPGIYPDQGWLGRVINALGEPIDGKGPLPRGQVFSPLRAAPPLSHLRRRVGAPLQTGVRVVDCFTTCCEGQRLGIFAGSGVGKSVLMSMLARHAASDVAIIGLVGERGREVKEFLEDDLGEEGLARSIVVVATSDETALMRRQAALLTLTLSEYFRDRGAHVLCMMDSVTRFAMAQREIGLAIGEPPTSKGYTPSVFAELPQLLERAGPGHEGQGSITGLFSVLVDGDDHNEPVADAVRGILDGHLVMERAIAERGRFPAVNVLKSISRTMPRSTPEEWRALIRATRGVMATYSDMEELIRLGAYRAGSSAEVDRAIRLMPQLDSFLAQGKEESTSMGDGYRRLAEIMVEG
jgi:flagellum-specific ATP synthase